MQSTFGCYRVQHAKLNQTPTDRTATEASFDDPEICRRLPGELTPMTKLEKTPEKQTNNIQKKATYIISPLKEIKHASKTANQQEKNQLHNPETASRLTTAPSVYNNAIHRSEINP